MFDLFKAKRINKITRDHAENVSDSLIMLNIVSAMEAKKNLSQEEFKNFYDLFGEISKRKEEIPSNSLQYEHRAFSIAYEFETDAGVPYEKICGEATDILYMYTNMKPRYDELIEDVYSEYKSIIDGLIDGNNLTESAAKIWAYAVSFFLTSTSTIIGSFASLRFDFFTKFIYERSFKKLHARAVLEYVKEYENVPEYKANRNRIEQIHEEAYEHNETLEGYIENYTNSFLFLTGAKNYEFTKISIIKMLNFLKELGEKGQV